VKNSEFADEFQKRTKKFAIDVILMYKKLPKTDDARLIGRQLLKAATSVASNYRAACRARSDNEFFSKISIVVEEADESVFWMELLNESGLYAIDENLFTEANEILSVVARSRKTMKNKTQQVK
jgi:four helix bundle protein